MSDRKRYSLIICTLGCTVFLVAFIVTLFNYRNAQVTKNLKGKDYAVSKIKFENIVNKNTKVNFITKYNKSEEIKTKEYIAGENLKEIIGYNEEKIISKYKKQGYTLKKMTSEEVMLIKELDRYSPNKYVLGLKEVTMNGEKNIYLAIFKTDKNGKMFIENEETDIKKMDISYLREADINYLKNGCKELQFNTKKEAEIAVSEYET